MNLEAVELSGRQENDFGAWQNAHTGIRRDFDITQDLNLAAPDGLPRRDMLHHSWHTAVKQCQSSTNEE